MASRAWRLSHNLISRIDRFHDKCSPLVVNESREYGTWSSVQCHNAAPPPSRLGSNPIKNVRPGSVSGISDQFQAPQTFKLFSTKAFSGNYGGYQPRGSFESPEEFEQRIFSGSSGNNHKSDFILQSLHKVERAYGKSGPALNERDGLGMLDGLDDGFSTLSDGMEGKLKKAATYFDFDEEEIMQEDYSFRPDMSFRGGSTYDVKDLDLTKPRVSKFRDRQAFQVTTEEVMKKADFRNVKFLANFITEAGIIIKRSQTRIKAKAQRKVAREIKTARAFGLMPFTTMGTKSFVYGKTMEDLDKDYEYETYNGRLIGDDKDPEG